jgi:NADPH-dependent curcumin reductase
MDAGYGANLDTDFPAAFLLRPSMSTNQRILYARNSQGVPVVEDFARDSVSIPKPEAGQFLARTIYLALEPYYRSVMKGIPLYGANLKPGEVMFGETIAQVMASHHPEFAVGDYVLSKGGWQQYSVSDGVGVRKLNHDAALPLSASLGVLGTPGLTGYAGMVYLAPPRPGQTVVVSAATGPVGSTVGQVARLMGARVVGIAGSKEKCDYAINTLGYADCVNYKDGALKDLLKQACPDGIDVYFDNVGGEVLVAAMANLAMNAQLVLCGMMEAYSSDKPLPGPSLVPIVMNRATVKGLVVFDHFQRLPELARVVGGWIKQGKFHYREDISIGLEQAPAAFCRLMRGENFGKTLVRVAAEQL